jgi:hypothetical protein
VNSNLVKKASFKSNGKISNSTNKNNYEINNEIEKICEKIECNKNNLYIY